MANGLVQCFGDCLHPYEALTRMISVRQMLPLAVRPWLNDLVGWLKLACHQGATSRASSLATEWRSITLHERNLHLWGKARHDMMIRPLPPPPVLPLPSQPQGISEERAFQISEEIARQGREKATITKGCRKLRHDEWEDYKGWAGLRANATKDEAPPFVSK